MNQHPIYVVDDDRDDEEMLREVMEEMELKNELKFFYTAESLLQELSSSPVVPFLIICDINLPAMDGFQLREEILARADVKDKTIPFIFWSTTATQTQVKRAYELSAHGFFIKGRTYKEVKEAVTEIVKYWSHSLSPR